MSQNEVVRTIDWDAWMRANHVKIDQITSIYRQTAEDLASLKEKAEKCEKHSS